MDLKQENLKPPQCESILDFFPCYIMIGSALVGLAWSAHSVFAWFLAFPVLLLLAAHPAVPWRFRLSYLGYMVLAIPVAFLYNTVEMDGNSGLDYNTSFYMAYYLQIFATLRLYLKPPDRDRSPVVLVCSGIGVASFGADAPSEEAYLGLLAVFSLGMLLMLRTNLRVRGGSRSWRLLSRFAVVAGVVISVLVSFCIVIFLNRYYADINNFMQRLMVRGVLSPSKGFGESSKIGTIPDMNRSEVNMQIALRAFGSVSPGYLRGKVYLTYGNSQWSTVHRGIEYDPWDTGKKAVAGQKKDENRTVRWVIPGRVPPLKEAESDILVVPEGVHGAVFFMPLSASAVETSSKRLLLFPGLIVNSKRRSTSRGYNVFLDELSPVFERRDLLPNLPYAEPERVNGVFFNAPTRGTRLYAALSRVVVAAKKETPYRDGDVDGMIKSFKRYFDKSYYYKFGINFSTNSPMVEWLDKASPDMDHGHCELFATAGTLMMRMEGVPARYVTGFVCDEKNPYGDIWVARNKHAHAWVEYFDRKKGWRLAEFTPASGLPDSVSPQGTDALWEYIAGLWGQAKAVIIREGFNGVLKVIGSVGLWMVATWPRRIVVALLMIAFFAYRILRIRKKRRQSLHPPREFPEDIARQREEFARIEKALRRKKLGKLDGETLGEYALRLSKVDVEALPERDGLVDFIRRFECVRYARF